MWSVIGYLVGIRLFWLGLSIAILGQSVWAEETKASAVNDNSAGAQAASVPRLVQFSGVLKDRMGQPLTGVQGITFALYKDQQDGAPLWLETQNVTADEQGRFAALLGATQPEGLPLDLFTSGQAHFLGVQAIQSRDSDGAVLDEQPRILLASVPYALATAAAQPAASSAVKSASADSPPQAGASPQGDITAVIAGNGLSGGGAGGDVTLQVMPCSPGQILKWTGNPGAWNCRGDDNSGGTVTSVGSGPGLTGGPITTTGTLSVADGGIVNTMLGPNAVTTDKILGGNVTTAKLADSSVTTTKLAFDVATQAELDAQVAAEAVARAAADTSLQAAVDTKVAKSGDTMTGTLQATAFIGDGSGLTNLTAGSAGMNGIAEFTATGTFIPPPGVTRILLELWGAGGGGGGATTFNNTNCPPDPAVFCIRVVYTSGGAGGSGGYARAAFAVVPGTSYTVTIGQGGSGGGTYADGLPGGTSRFSPQGASDWVIAPGGGGGGQGCPTLTACPNILDVRYPYYNGGAGGAAGSGTIPNSTIGRPGLEGGPGTTTYGGGLPASIGFFISIPPLGTTGGRGGSGSPVSGGTLNPGLPGQNGYALIQF